MSVIKVLVSDLWGNKQIRLLIIIYALLALPIQIFFDTLGCILAIWDIGEDLTLESSLATAVVWFFVIPFALPLLAAFIAYPISKKGIKVVGVVFPTCYLILFVESLLSDKLFNTEMVDHMTFFAQWIILRLL